MPRVYSKRAPYPRGALYCGRPSIAGNEFVVGVDGDRDECCDRYEAAVEADPARKARLIALCRGRDLLCWCTHPGSKRPKRCHCDYLLRISNP